MDICLRNAFNSNMRIVIFVYVTMAALLGVGGTDIYETKDTESVDSSDFRKIWDLYIMPRLEMELKMKNANQRQFPESESADYYNMQDIEKREIEGPGLIPQIRQRRYGIAGLDNMDILTTTLDKAKAMHALPMSVRLPMTRMRQLMMAAGRRRK